MSKLYIYLMILLSVIFTGCEEAVDIDTDTAPPKLVVDASIAWQKGTAGNEQMIKLTTTANYENTNPPRVSGATVSVKNSANTVFNFTETPNTGEYVCTDFVPEVGETYTLTILYNGQTYTATESLKTTPPIDYVTQEIAAGVGEEEDRIDVKAYFTDSGTTRDYYLFKFQSTTRALPEFGVTDDEFFNGNQIFGLYFNEDQKPGDLVEIKLYGISERYYYYMEKLMNIVGGNGPFGVPAGVLRGNVVNTTNPADYPLGYFNVSEIDTKVYTIQ